MRRRGFTLLELMVVVAIVGLAAAVASVRLGGVYRRAQLEDAVERLAALDRFARASARATGRPVELRFDVTGGRVGLREKGARDGPLRVYALPSALEFARVETPREERTSGEVVVRFTRNGASDTYAVRVASPSGRERRLLFAGLSGQRIEDARPRDQKEFFRALSKNRFDAD